MLVNRCIINPPADEVGSSSESGPAYAVGINNQFMKNLQFLLELFYAQLQIVLFCILLQIVSVFWTLYPQEGQFLYENSWLFKGDKHLKHLI